MATITGSLRKNSIALDALTVEGNRVLTTADGNIELADATGQVLGDNVLGQVDGRLAVGDGVTTGGNQIVTKHNDGEKLTIDDWNWTFSSGVGVLDTSPTQSATALNIPAVGFPQKIDDNKFVSETLWTGLTIPNSVTTIGSNAFSYCSGFTGSLTIPNSVTTIGSGAFYYCSGFTGNLTISNSVTSIGNNAFHGCSGFTGNLTLPNSVTSIGYSAFYYCSGFTGNLTIPNSVTSIGSSAFEYCNGMTGNLTIPNSVTTIGYYAFQGCSGFTGNLTIPDSVTSIGGHAFYNCNGITNVNCYITKTIIDASTDCFSATGITTLHARSSDGTWSAGAGQTIGGKTGITVIKDL